MVEGGETGEKRSIRRLGTGGREPSGVSRLQYVNEKETKAKERASGGKFRSCFTRQTKRDVLRSMQPWRLREGTVAKTAVNTPPNPPHYSRSEKMSERQILKSGGLFSRLKGEARFTPEY